ncbi:hypothetical protein ACWFZ6_07905 [Methylorubrum extorquens]
MRADTSEGLGVFGVALDPVREAVGETRIRRDGSRAVVYVVPADGELPIARAAMELLSGA